jgi:hypothetical protein
MRDTLVHAKVGVAELRASLEKTRIQLQAEQRELETAQRRGRLADGIGDAETSAIAARFVDQHAQRVQVFTRKLEAQDAEIRLAEAGVEEMTAELKRLALGRPDARGQSTSSATSGTEGAPSASSEGRAAGASPDAGPGSPPGASPGAPSGGPLDLDADERLRADLDALARANRRAAREAQADERLADLKRRMEQ